MAQIKLDHVTKKFEDVIAIEDINLSIEKGEIFGIIGMSGAGKSTLVRCLNFLERPTSGEVEVEGAVFDYNGDITEEEFLEDKGWHFAGLTREEVGE